MVGAVEKSGKGWFGADKKLNQPANQAKPNHLPAPSLRRETLSSSALNLIHHIPALHAGSLCCQFLSVCFLNTFKHYRRRLSEAHILTCGGNHRPTPHWKLCPVLSSVVGGLSALTISPSAEECDLLVDHYRT